MGGARGHRCGNCCGMFASWTPVNSPRGNDSPEGTLSRSLGRAKPRWRSDDGALAGVESARGFEFKAYYGWISEMATRPLMDDWPVIQLDPPMLRDFEITFDLCKRLGYDHVVIWGLGVSRDWPVPVARALGQERRKQVQLVIDSAHRRGLKVLSGLGVYSWGFQEIIRQNPHLSKTNPEALCASLPESEEWMNKVTDLVMGSLDVDGVEMQSADQGRCSCPSCSQWSDLQYHARLNEYVARYIRSKWPGKLIGMNNWGLPFDAPAEFPALVRMSDVVDWIIDSNNSAGVHRTELIQALKCPYGTLAGRSVWPPQKWTRDRWFVPVTTTNADYLRELHDDGARAVEQFAVALTNPGDEVSLRFSSKIINDPQRPAEEALLEAVSECLDPKDLATARGLMECFLAAEAAYFRCANADDMQEWGRSNIMTLDDGLHYRENGRIQYLAKMTNDNLAAYGKTMERLEERVRRFQGRVGHERKLERIQQSLLAVLADVQMLKT